MTHRGWLVALIALLPLAAPGLRSASAAPSLRCFDGPDGSEPGPHRFFSLRVVDPQGEPLSCVELRTLSNVAVVTDELGIAAFFEPGLMNQQVYFELRRFGRGETSYAGIDGLPEQFIGITVDVCEGEATKLVARETTKPVDSVHPPGCPPGSWQARLVDHLVPGPGDVFAVRVVDSDTGRGIPMVEARFPGGADYTDSNGVLAHFDPPTMLDRRRSCDDRKVAPTNVRYASPGYGTRTVAHRVCPGAAAAVALERLDVAQRLYRFTGAGIYRDSVLLGLDDPNDPHDGVPVRAPVLNSSVAGLDFGSAVAFDGKVFWTFSDTKRIGGPYGNFRGTGATSELDGLDPDLGVDLSYIEDARGDFVRAMVPTSTGYPGPAWLLGLAVVETGAGESLYASIRFVGASVGALGRLTGEGFVSETEFTGDTPEPSGSALRIRHADGDYLYRQNLLRHPATRSAILAPEAYEVFTPLCGAGADPACDADGVERDPDGLPRYRWRPGGLPVTADHVEAGLVRPEQAIFGKLRDLRAGIELWSSGATVAQGSYNEFRGRFIRLWPTAVFEPEGIALAVHYAESDTPMGPWVYARQVLSVPQTMYAVFHLPSFDRADGRIYFQATHSNSFGFGSLQPPRIPRYDYNQLMHALDLGDPRLFLPIPVYDLAGGGPPGHFVTRRGLLPTDEAAAAAFFAWDRPAEQTLAVTRTDSEGRLVAGGPSTQPPLFFVLPATDRDRDGLADVLDPCLEAAGSPGAESGDPDRDGYGVACDGDYDNDGVVDRSDLKRLRRLYGRTAADADFDPNLDHDADGRIGKNDWAIFRRLLRAPPGPSGLACAGTVPCLPETNDLVPLHEFIDEHGAYAYSLEEALSGFTRTAEDLGLVWRNPIAVAFPVTDYLR